MQSSEQNENPSPNSPDNLKKAPDDLVDYEFAVLLAMIRQLPESVRKPLVEQTQKLKRALFTQNRALFDVLGNTIDDIKVGILAQQFDLEATKREKTELQNKLDGK